MFSSLSSIHLINHNGKRWGVTLLIVIQSSFIITLSCQLHNKELNCQCLTIIFFSESFVFVVFKILFSLPAYFSIVLRCLKLFSSGLYTGGSSWNEDLHLSVDFLETSLADWGWIAGQAHALVVHSSSANLWRELDVVWMVFEDELSWLERLHNKFNSEISSMKEKGNVLNPESNSFQCQSCF